MLEIKNIEVVGLQRSLLASGNAMTVGEINTKLSIYESSVDGWDTIMKRGKNLGSARLGSGHDHYLCGIDVYMDIKYPLYWSAEAQRYHWFEIITSQSTMHKLTLAGSSEEFFSMFNQYVDLDIIRIIQRYCELYNSAESDEQKYEWFMKARSNLPSGYEMWMTVKTNYLQLKTMYTQRKNHKLKEDWNAFIAMCDELPMFKELTGV